MRFALSRFVWLCLASAPAFAQTVSLPSSGTPVRPRVFVVFDSSTSMMQDPAYRVNYNLWTTDDTRADPDTQFVTPADCRSKFCIAKDVVYNVLKSHAEDVRIGVASYYQYIAKFDPRDDRSTKCWYDAMFKPGFTLYFPRTGTTPTRFGSVSSVGDVATNIELGGVTGGHQQRCFAGHQYDLTATVVNPTGTQTCTVYNQRVDPGTFTPGTTVGTCVSGQTYTVPAGGFQVAPSTCAMGGACLIRTIPAASMCPAAVDPMTITASTTPSLVVTGDTAGENGTDWDPSTWTLASIDTECSAGLPCNMYSAGAGDPLPLRQSWYGLFDGACPAGGAGPGGAFNCPNPSTTWPATARPFRHPTRVDSAVSTFTGVLTGQSSCVGALNVRTRYTDNGARTRFMTTGQYNAATGTIPAPGGSSVSTPTSNCSPEWPCDTELTAQVTEPAGTPALSDVGTCPSPLGAGQTCNPNGLFGTFNIALTLGSTCPSLTGTYASNPSYNWSPNPSCGAGNNQCQFQPSATPSSTSTSSCAATVFRWDDTSQPNCSARGLSFSYSGGLQEKTPLYRDIPASSSCPADLSDADNPGVFGSRSQWGPSETERVRLDQCRAASHACTLRNFNETTSPVNETQWSNSTTAPTGFSAASPVSDRRGSGTFDITGSCASYTTGVTYSLSGQFGRFVPGSGPGGATEVARVGENITYRCRFENWERAYVRPMKRCNYELQRTTYTTDNRFTTCNYDRRRFQLSTPPPTTYRCEYANVVRRFDFTFPDRQQCKYYRLSTRGDRTVYQYVYSYLTRGGEFAGAWSTEVPGDVTSASVDYSTFSSTCPAVRDNCLGPNTVCYLRNSSDTSSGNLNWTQNRNTGLAMGSAATDGRFLGTGGIITFSDPSNFPTLTGMAAGRNGSGRSCIARDYATPPTTEPARNRYTVSNGAAAPGAPQYRLVSDYFRCADPDNPASCDANSVADINSDGRSPPSTLNPGTMPGGPFQPLTAASWTNGATKAFGFSGVGAAYNTPSQMFMPFPDDADPTGNLSQLKQLMSQCERPTGANVNATTLAWSGRGICMPDVGAPNAEGLGDFTPLYGSLQNVRQYIKNSLAADTTFTGERTCRKYFVILATDGAENTPGNYANERSGTLVPTQLQSAVESLRNVYDPGSNKRVDVKTYVVGFGDATADPASASLLNAMADRGGTIGAYFASDRAGLITELNRVLAGALEGTYSRSKPVISTDGKSIFASTFDRDGTTPEWRGNFYAYGISPSDGTLSERWNLAPKLNGMTDGDRNLYVDIPGGASRAPFDEGSATLNTRLTAHPNYPDDGPGGSPDLDPDRLVRFVRNAGRNEQFFSSPARRQSRLNAVIHSSPVVVGKSVLPPWWGGPDGSAARTSFAAFQTATASRQERVIVGASDGLLRGVRDNTGTAANDGLEAWGWVPSPIHRFLFRSMLGGYNGMDGQIAVADVCANDLTDLGNARECATGDWKTLAVAAAGRGGRGLIALDVTQPDNPQKLWHFNNTSDFGYAWSAPVIGRVELSDRDQYLVLFGGGVRAQGVDGPLSDEHGDEVFMLNAMNGNTVRLFDATGELESDDIFGEDNQFAARPSFWQRAGSPYMDHAVFAGTNGNIYMSRFRKRVRLESTGVSVEAQTDPDRWQPEVWFDPRRGSTSRTPSNQRVDVRRVKVDNTDPANPVYSQVTDDPAAVRDDVARTPDPWSGETLPLSRSLPIWVRPRSTAVTNSARLIPDYFVGTGDGLNPGDPRSEYRWNYFYAIHDSNRSDDGKHDGAPLWVNQFIHEREQVVSEPALVQGALIVATYLPPTTTSPCENAGDTFLYCFNPTSGDLVRCLVNPDGTATSVKKLSGVGIPSDLVTVDDNLYLTASNVSGPPIVERTRPTIDTGDIRSWRRVR